MNKSDLRKKYKEIRDNLSKEGLAEKLAKNFFKQVKLSRNSLIASYYPIGSEADVHPINHELIERGHQICLPYLDGKNIYFRKWDLFTAMNASKIPEPDDTEIVANADIDLFIVPLMAFDKNNYRLGYGGGYYDRVLANVTARKIGVAYRAQFADELPIEEHDIALDVVVTE